jgi:uncharacterized MAPEG superfamily protein
MTTDLIYLALTALLTGSLWIPYVIAQSITNGPLKPQNYTDPAPRPMPLWGVRANRTHINAVESFAPFAVLVLLAHVTNKVDAMTVFWATSFFWLRLVHAVVYLLGAPYVRTIVFTLGWICLVGLFWGVMK